MRRYGAVLLLVFAAFSGSGRAEQRNVLVEVFTNSHCVLCPPAHSALDAYLANSPNGQFIRLIFYHMAFPYPDDPLYQANPTDPAARNSYYGPFSATPVTFFDGINAGTAYATWAGVLDARAVIPSALSIRLTGTVNGNSVTIEASITRNGTVPQGPLALHMVAVEDVTYAGRNGVTPQKFVMRSMITGPNGEEITVADGETKVISRSATLTNLTSFVGAGFVVFVQDVPSRGVLQSEYIPAGLLTGVGDSGHAGAFALEQNFPNPFNPSTTIIYSLPVRERISLEVFDMLGARVAVLARGYREAGRHRVIFDGAGLATGAYVVRLTAGSAVSVRTIMLLR